MLLYLKAIQGYNDEHVSEEDDAFVINIIPVSY